MNDFKNFEDVKKYFIDLFYVACPNKFYEQNNEKLKALSIDIDILTRWSNEYYCKKINKLLDKIPSSYYVEKFIDFDKILLPATAYTEIFFTPTYELCEKIILLYEKLESCTVKNPFDFKKSSFYMTLLDFYSRYQDYLIDPHTSHRFTCCVLNDSTIYNINFVYSYNIPYKTEKRFTGLLPYLFYSKYKELYEKLFSLLIEIIEKNYEFCMPLPYFLYNFVSENDTDKKDMVLKMIEKLKNEHPFYCWKSPLRLINSSKLFITEKYFNCKIEDLLK